MGGVECKNACHPRSDPPDVEWETVAREKGGLDYAIPEAIETPRGGVSPSSSAPSSPARISRGLSSCNTQFGRNSTKGHGFDNVGNTEALQWLNFLISHCWPELGNLASHFVEFKIEPILRKKLPERLKGMKLSKFTIGARPGKIQQVEVYDLPHGTSCVHAELDCQSEMHIEWEVKGFTFGIKDFSLKGEIVFLLRPFIEEHVGTGGATMFFINPPEMDFKFTGLARIAEFKGIKGIIRSALDDAIADVLVLPNVITQLMRYSDFSLYPMVMGDPVPIGLLRVKTVSAKDLPSGDFTFFGLFSGGVDDNYVKIALGNDRWKVKVNKPSLGAQHDFVVYDPEQKLIIDLWDEDKYTDDDHLGHAGPFILPEAVALSGKPIHFHDPSSPTTAAGRIVLQIKFYLGTPRSLAPVVNAVMLPIREVHVPPAKGNSKLYVLAQMGDVRKQSRTGVIMRNLHKENTIDSVMTDMRERLRKHGLMDSDVEKLTSRDGLRCTSQQVSVAINECMTFMIPDGAAFDGEIRMSLMEVIESDSPKKRGAKKRVSAVEFELGRYVIKLRDLKKAPQLTLKGPAVFKHPDGASYNVEVSAFMCGFNAGKPEEAQTDGRVLRKYRTQALG